MYEPYDPERIGLDVGTKFTSTRPLCKYCKTPLSGFVRTVKNSYKLDNGDPDELLITECPNLECGKVQYMSWNAK